MALVRRRRSRHRADLHFAAAGAQCGRELLVFPLQGGAGEVARETAQHGRHLHHAVEFLRQVRAHRAVHRLRTPRPVTPADLHPAVPAAVHGPTDVATLMVPFTVRAITGAVAATPTEPFMVNASTFTPVGTYTVNATLASVLCPRSLLAGPLFAEW